MSENVTPPIVDPLYVGETVAKPMNKSWVMFFQKLAALASSSGGSSATVDYLGAQVFGG